MKQTILVTTAALSLAACSAQPPANNGIAANDSGAVANEQAPALPEPSNTLANEVTPPQAETAAPAAKAGPDRQSRPASEAPRPAPKAQPVDPHAGHDMGNMANMSH